MAIPSFPSLDQLPPAHVAKDNSYPLFATCIAFLVMETTFAILLYVSRFLSSEKNANWYMLALMTGAYIACLGKNAIGVLAVHIGGAGHHSVTLPPSTIVNSLKLGTALRVACPLTTSLTKMSICCLLYTILGRTSERARLAIRVTFALTLITLLVQFIIPFVNCRPFSKTWALDGKEYCTIDDLALWRYLSIPNVLTTLMVFVIPIPAMYKLRVDTATKIGLGVILGVCVCGAVAAIMRFASFLAVESFDDFNYVEIKPLCWTIAESGIYLVAGVLPTLRPLMQKILSSVHFEKILSGRFKTSKGSRDDGSWGNKSKPDGTYWRRSGSC